MHSIIVEKRLSFRNNQPLEVLFSVHVARPQPVITETGRKPVDLKLPGRWELPVD